MGRAVRRKRALNTQPISLPDLPEGASDPAFREFYDHWRRASPPGLLPGRQHIDPVARIPWLVANLALFDVVPGKEGLRFRVSQIGELMVNVTGSDPTGRFVDDLIKPEFRSRVNAAFAQVARERVAHYWENPMWTHQNDFIRMRRLALPLASDGRNVDAIFACYVRSDEPTAEEHRLEGPASDGRPRGVRL
jgi:hypothetical protein